MALKPKTWSLARSPATVRLLLPAKGALVQPPIRELWAAVALPQLALDVLPQVESAASQPLVCSVEKAGRVLVHVANSEAASQGVVTGMAVSAAQALCPAVVSYPRQIALELAALEHLAQALYGFSALVHVEALSEQLAQASQPSSANVVPVILLELKASLDLFGGLAPLLARLRQTVAAHSTHVCVAVAPTPSAAKLLALAGDEHPLLQTSQLAGRLAQLPLQQLAAVNPQWLARLEKLGLATVGEILRLSQAGLRKRFGDGFFNYVQQLQGQAPDLLPAWQPPQSYEASQNLMEELDDSQRLMPALSEMLAELCSWLQQRTARIQGFEFALFGHRQCISRVVVSFLRPHNRLEPMQKLLALRLEQEVLSAPVVSLTLTAKNLLYPQALQQGQQSLWAGEQTASDSWWETLESIQTKLGPQSVQALRVCDEHRPELAWKSLLPSQANADSGAEQPKQIRPLWLYQQPRRLNRTEQKQLQLCSRPERIASGWWDKDPVYRDYFVAQLQGRKLWVFRGVSTAKNVWYCHGAFH